jgi:exosortase/archaeosortase family protein
VVAAAAAVWLVVILLARAGVPAPAGALAPLTALVAALVQHLLAWDGLDVLRHGALLYVPGGFAYEVVAGCTGIVPAAMIVVAIAASPASGTARRRGLAVAVPLVLAVNLLRLAHLFYLGVHAPRHFAIAHTLLWEAALVLVTLGIWQVWWRWAQRREGAAPGRLSARFSGSR